MLARTDSAALKPPPAGRRALWLTASAMVLSFLAGCGAPPATLELTALAQKALVDAAALEKDRHAEALDRLSALSAALDSAFDADVKLVAAGRISDSDGKIVPLTAEWVISARIGYAAARDALSEQRSRAKARHARDLDNLSAASEALEMARTLIIRQADISARSKQFLMSLQRRFINER